MRQDMASKQFKEDTKAYASEVFEDKEHILHFEKLMDNLLKFHNGDIDDVYRDLKHVSDKCKYCTYISAPPEDGSFASKTDYYLKDRSKWALMVWGLVGSLVAIITGLYMYIFLQVATTVFEIKDLVIRNTANIETSMKDIDALERIHLMKESK